MANAFGKIRLVNFEAERLPQKAQTAWDGANMDGVVYVDGVNGRAGAKFVPIRFCGDQPVNGTLYWYIAERTILYKTEIRNVIKMAILEKDGEYTFLDDSVTEIF